MSQVRRVVTGLTDDGRSVVVSDEDVPPVRTRAAPGAEWHLLWADDAPVLGRGGAGTAYFPPPGGVRFGTFALPPGGSAETPDDGAARAEMDALLPGLRATLTADPSGMHATASIDLEVVLAGEVVLELPDGPATRLTAGDTVVQNGAVHRWVNRGTVPAVIALVMVGLPPR
ncbi:hypothetical protein [Geodermatophilus sp. SYSU D00815]